MFWNGFKVYFQIKDGVISAKELTTGKTASEKCQGCTHPRMLMGNFRDVESTFNLLIKELAKSKFLAPAPKLIIHLQDEVDAGCSEIEARAYKEAGFGAGAREVDVIYSQRPISEQSLLSGNYEAIEL